MTTHRFGSYAMIAGAVLAMLVFAFHPSHVEAAPLVGLFTLSQLVHGTALVAAPLLLLGMWQLADWLGATRPFVRLGLVLAALAMALTVNAAVISNFVTPAAARAAMSMQHARSGPPSAHSSPAVPMHAVPMRLEQMPPLIQAVVAMNRGFAQVHVAFLSLALLFFGLALLERNRLLGGAGVLVGLYPILWQLSGRFSPETTTMPWIAFPQGAWMIAVAAIMLRNSSARAGESTKSGGSPAQ